MKKYIYLIVMSVVLSGCASQNKVALHTGYFQEGAFQQARYQPSYYDAYGRVHTAQEIDSHYQEARYHRGALVTPLRHYDATQTAGSDWLATPVLVGAVGGAALASTFVDGGLTSLLLGGAIGAYAGKTMADQLDDMPY